MFIMFITSSNYTFKNISNGNNFLVKVFFEKNEFIKSISTKIGDSQRVVVVQKNGFIILGNTM